MKATKILATIAATLLVAATLLSAGCASAPRRVVTIPGFRVVYTDLHEIQAHGAASGNGLARGLWMMIPNIIYVMPGEESVFGHEVQHMTDTHSDYKTPPIPDPSAWHNALFVRENERKDRRNIREMFGQEWPMVEQKGFRKYGKAAFFNPKHDPPSWRREVDVPSLTFVFTDRDEIRQHSKAVGRDWARAYYEPETATVYAVEGEIQAVGKELARITGDRKE
jgi:hypothetical protein